MHMYLPLALWASIACIVLCDESPASLTGEHTSSDSSPLTDSAPSGLSRTKRGGSINYRRLARGLHMLRLGKRGGAETETDPTESVDPNEDSEKLNELLELLKMYRDDLSSIPVSYDETDEIEVPYSYDDVTDFGDYRNRRDTLASSEEGDNPEFYDVMDPMEGGMEESKRGLSMLRLGKRGLSMLRLGKRDNDGEFEKKQDEDLNDVYGEDNKRGMAMLRLGKRPMSMLRLGKRPMSMLRLGKRPMSMLRLGKRGMAMLRLGKRPMSMLRLGKRPMSMLRLGKRPMSMLRLGKRPMSMLRLGKRPMSMLRLGKRPMSMLRLGKRPMSMLRLGKRSVDDEPEP